MAGIKKPAACVKLLSTGTEENTPVLNGFFCELIGIYVSLNQ
jgi:hypothetical protein